MMYQGRWYVGRTGRDGLCSLAGLGSSFYYLVLFAYSTAAIVSIHTYLLICLYKVEVEGDNLTLCVLILPLSSFEIIMKVVMSDLAEMWSGCWYDYVGRFPSGEDEGEGRDSGWPGNVGGD